MKGVNARARIIIKQRHQLQNDRPRNRRREQVGEHVCPGDVLEAQDLLGDEVAQKLGGAQGCAWCS